MPILLALLLPAVVVAVPAVVRDLAGNHIVPLVPVRSVEFAAKPGERTALLCSASRNLCIEAARDGAGANWIVRVYGGLPGPGNRLAAYNVDVGETRDEIDLWPRAVMSPGGQILVGHVKTQSTAYSGGGANMSQLSLAEIVPGETTAKVVMTVPWSGGATIRACFGARDSRIRAGACEDDYDFSATLTLDPITRTGRPRLRMTTVAKTFPGKLSRQADNSGKRLTKKDFVWARDPACSYSRLFAWSATTRGYAANRPLPACADYLEM